MRITMEKETLRMEDVKEIAENWDKIDQNLEENSLERSGQ